MTNWIEHFVEPQRLILAWQAPEDRGDRFRWAVGEVRQDSEITFRYYDRGEEFAAANGNRTYGQILALGFRGYPAFDPEKAIHQRNVIDVFFRRLPPANRTDFASYLGHFHIPAGAPLTALGLLGLTEAKLPSDGFSLVDPLEGDRQPRDLFTEVAGHRHHRGKVPLEGCIGETVEFIAEPANEYDPFAVMIRLRGGLLGYVNRLQSPAFRRWIAQGNVDGVVERINGTEAWPRIFVFVRFRPAASRAAA